jgi:hypothetical protein
MIDVDLRQPPKIIRNRYTVAHLLLLDPNLCFLHDMSSLLASSRKKWVGKQRYECTRVASCWRRVIHGGDGRVCMSLRDFSTTHSIERLADGPKIRRKNELSAIKGITTGVWTP